MPEIYAILLNAHRMKYGADAYCSVYYGSLAQCEGQCGQAFSDDTVLPWPKSDWLAVRQKDCAMEHASGAPAPGRIARMDKLR